LSILGEGNTSKVYLVRDIRKPHLLYALKLIKNNFIQKHQENTEIIEQEMKILSILKHKNIIGTKSYGFDGSIVKPTGKIIGSLPYILMEYVPGGILFDFC